MPTANLWLSRFAKLTVAAALFLIFVGGHTTTSGAGMAFPDWPLSHGSVNPAGWWTDFMERLEHGHRLTAETVGLLVGTLCAWVWRSRWAVPGAIGASLILAFGANLLGAPPQLVAHVGLWSAAVVFAIVLFARGDGQLHPASVRWLAFAAFVGVLIQAVLGGLRVTIESGGDASAAMKLRIIHGCFAQIELCLLVALAAMLSPAYCRIKTLPALRIARFAWITVAVVFVQLAVGAAMRHLGAGLAIPTFPRTPDGGWMLRTHSVYLDLNFTHTRFGALAVSVFVLTLVARTLLRAGAEPSLRRPALLLLALLVAQVTLGVFVIWNMRPPLLTTLHVVNGASLLATVVLLALRLSRSQAAPRTSPIVADRTDLREAIA